MGEYRKLSIDSSRPEKNFERLISYVEPGDPFWKRLTIHSLERLTGRRKLEQMYQALKDRAVAPDTFWEAALAMLDIELDYDPERLHAIPERGPVVIIANHPFGVVDGLSICYLAGKVRPHFKILTNSVLCQDASLNRFMLPVDFGTTKEAIRTNIQTKNLALHTLEDDGAIVLFPGGGVSTAKYGLGPAQDLEWKRFAAKLIQTAEATVVPVYFHGQNSRLFQIVSQFSLTLRLGLLLREVTNKRGLTLQITIGRTISYSALAHLKDRQELLDRLRAITYELAHHP